MRLLPIPGLIFTRGSALPVSTVLRGDSAFYVAAKDRVLLAEIQPYVQSVIWRLNGINEAHFTIAANDSKATKLLLGMGNHFYAKFSNGLPDWGGVIDHPMEWSNDGTIVVDARGPQFELENRYTGKNEAYTALSPGEILSGLILNTNAMRDTGIRMGTVWTGGGTHTVAFHHQKLYDVIREQCCERLADADYEVAPSISGNVITYTLNYVETRGSQKEGVALIEGHNAFGVCYSEQGPITNSWYIIGSGATWGGARPVGHAQNDDSIATYGLYEGVESYGDISSETMLNAIATNRLGVTDTPRIRVSARVIDKAPAKFSAYSVGDTIRCIMHTKGFDGLDGYVRVTAREYNPNENTCSLVLEVK
jgi:hypothetical protein